MATPQFRDQRCARFHFRYSACARCAEACPHAAITLSDEGIAISAERCRDCGLCAAACRTGALEADNLRPVELLKRALSRPRISIACAPSQERADETVPCLGALDAVTLAYLARRGIATELRGSSHCAQCVHGAQGATGLALHLDALERLRAAAEGEQWAAVELAATQQDASRARAGFVEGRRQLFRRLLGGRGGEAPGPAGSPPSVEAPQKAIRAAAPYVSERRELLRIVAQRSDEHHLCVEPHPGLPALDIRIDDACTACEACFRVCPSAAIDIRESDESWSLTFEADRCVGCELCLEVCQPRALHADGPIDLQPGGGPRVWLTLSKQRCRLCDRYFVSPQPCDTCAICEDDDDAFTAIFG